MFPFSRSRCRPFLFILLIALSPVFLSGCIGAKIRALRNDIQLRDARILQLRQDLDATREAEEIARKDAEVLRERVESQEKLIKEMERDLSTMREQLAASRLALTSSLDSQSRELVNRLNSNLEAMQDLRIRIEELESTVASKDLKLLEAEHDLEESRAAAEEAAEKVRLLERAVANQETLLERTKSEHAAELERLRSEHETTLSEMRRTHSREVTELTSNVEDKERQLSRTTESLSSANSELRESRDRLEALEKERRELQEKAQALETQNKELAEAEAGRRTSGGVDARTKAAEELARKTLTSAISSRLADVKVEPGRLRMILFCDDLFDRGTTLLTDQGLSALRSIDDVIGATPHSRIYVEGHTDNTPVRNMPYPDNWELAAARASEVARWLAAQPGTDARKIIAQSRSYHDPMGDNQTAAGRRVNRRVEVILEVEPESAAGR